MRNAFMSISIILMVTTSSSAFASKLCGTVTHDFSDPNTFSLTEKNGTYWEVDANINDVALSLQSFSERTIQDHAVRVCVEGQVILHDEDKGYVFSASSAQQNE
jgi:hypothetical protein